MAFAALYMPEEIPSIPPTSLLADDLVMRLLIAGCRTPPPNAAGKLATNNHTMPIQPLFDSSGGDTLILWIAVTSFPPARPCITFSRSYQGTGMRGVNAVPIKPTANVETPRMTNQRSPFCRDQRPINPP